MNARRKIVFLILGLILPYLAFTMYFVVAISQHPGKVFPVWLAYLAFFYIFGSVALVMVVSRKLARTTSQHLSAKPQTTPWWVRPYASHLIAIWSGLFFYGAYRTIKGDIPIGRAIPAGAFLLAFIGLFAWSLYHDSQVRKHQANKK